ncbi:hypothetical protein MLD38_039970 [Melastoma candidum]|uniref:Uncharacterized protein n=1 Tax=Melastoma candidum TaxID=119954 RepID=A0ACB9L3S1_9MYRT|nr:hypothetical protein MLD38_039970 [Melastoma candidum]
MYNLGKAGLTFWSPNINVLRDPRWGRTLETPGEDPFVVGRHAVNFVRGLQDVEGDETVEDPDHRTLKVSSHAAYDIDAWMGVTERDMVETLLGPFETCVKDGDVSSVMCSYSRVNGIPTCTDPKLLQETIRGDWGLHGCIVSDCDSIQVMVDNHKFLGHTREEAVARSLKAGQDLDCWDYYTNFTAGSVTQGLARESEVDRSLVYLYVVLLRLGYFDGISAYACLGTNDICTDENFELAAQAALEGIVLLKNQNSTLPLEVDVVKNIAVIGPHANATAAMIGNYAGNRINDYEFFLAW